MEKLSASSIEKIQSMTVETERLKAESKIFYGVEHVRTADGAWRPVFDPKNAPEQVNVKSLESLVDLIVSEPDNFQDCLIVVNGPDHVEVTAAAKEGTGTRQVLATATTHNSCASVMSSLQTPKRSSNFMICLLSEFVNDNEDGGKLEELATIVSGMKYDVNSQSGEANGEEEYGVRKHVHSVHGSIPEVVTLQPIVSFPEVEQPKIMFVLKTTGSEGQGVVCELVQGGGDLWISPAVNRVKAYLRWELSKHDDTDHIPIV